MSIFDKINIIADNEPKVYDAGQVALLRASKYLTGVAVDNPLFIRDTASVPHRLDVKLESKNLIPYPPYNYGTYTSGGVTVWDKYDGTLEATGVASADCYYAVRTGDGMLTLPKGNYFFKALTTVGSYATFYAYITCYKGQGAATYDQYFDLGDGVAFQLAEDCRVAVALIVKSGYNADAAPITFKPQIERGTVATEYTPYVDDFCSVAVSCYGKNLATVNAVRFPLSGEVTVWEGRVHGSFVLSYKHNLTDIANPSAALFRWWYEDGTVGYGQSVGSGASIARFSGTITRIEALTWCEAKDGSVYDIQFEYGMTRTDFTAGAEGQTVTANEDGRVEGLISVHPTTVLTAPEGMVVRCSYLKEIDAYIESLLDNTAAASVQGDG